ncbi:MAG: ATP-binding protein, partial [Actinomycetota bacterium]
VRGIAVVSGPGGAGKSRLLAELARHAKVPVVNGRAFQADREEAWALGRILLREALCLDLDVASTIPERAAQALADIIPELAEVRSLGAVPLDAESRGVLAIQGAVSLLEATASRGAMIFVDDLQWTDPTTLRLLRELVRRPSRVGLVLAYRPEDVLHEGLISAFLKDLDQLMGRVSRCELGAFSADAIARLIDDEKLAGLIAEETDCSPLAVTEVVRALAAKGLIEPNGLGGWRSRSGGIYERAARAARAGPRRAVRARIEHHPPKQRELLGLLALVGGETPARVLATARQTEQQVILDDLDVLARAGLVRLGNEGWATAHDVIGESIVEGLERAERGRLHEMLARALSAEEGDPAELARHLLGAGDREAAVEVFAQAARRSLDRFANGEAERLADAGIQLEPGPLQCSRLLRIRAEARFRRGDLQGARADFRAVLAIIPAGPERSRVLTRMAMLISGSEDPAQACELIELALAEAGNLPEARAEALAVGSILDANTNRLERAEARAAEARALFEQLGDAEGVARTLEAEATAVLGRGRIREVAKMLDRAARLFRDAGMLMRVGTARSYRALALVWMGQASQALVDAEEALALERMLGHLEGEILSLGIRGHALAALGRNDEATRSAEEGLAIARRLGHRELTSAGLIILGIACQAAGELDRAETCFRESLEVAKGMPIFSAWAAACLALLLVARGDLAQAQLYVARAMAEAGIPLIQYEARLAQAELAVACGDPDALRITAEALALAEGGSHLTSAARLRELARLARKSSDDPDAEPG